MLPPLLRGPPEKNSREIESYELEQKRTQDASDPQAQENGLMLAAAHLQPRRNNNVKEKPKYNRYENDTQEPTAAGSRLVRGCADDTSRRQSQQPDVSQIGSRNS